MKKKEPKVYAIVLAGGGGTRLWPMSRKRTPKQMLPFIGKQTLLQTTMFRVRHLVPQSRIIIATNINHKKEIERQFPNFPKKQILYESEKRDTAAAIGFAAAVIHAKDPEAVITTVNSDQFIQNEKEYYRLLHKAAQVAYDHPSFSVLIGVNPTYPETGYGYIKIAKRFAKEKSEVFHVDRFVEKPDIQKARGYVKRWDYLWNPAMFVWRADTLLSLYRKYLPAHAALMKKIATAYGTNKFNSVVKKEFGKFKPISIDYGIMEKTEHMLVLPANFGWADIGHWRSVKDVLSKKRKENIVKGLHLGVDTYGSLIYGYSNRLIATIGISELVIIDTPDILLVCPKERSQDVKKIVEELNKKGLSKYV